jgi:hypothetical protein
MNTQPKALVKYPSTAEATLVRLSVKITPHRTYNAEIASAKEKTPRSIVRSADLCTLEHRSLAPRITQRRVASCTVFQVRMATSLCPMSRSGGTPSPHRRYRQLRKIPIHPCRLPVGCVIIMLMHYPQPLLTICSTRAARARDESGVCGTRSLSGG